MRRAAVLGAEAEAEADTDGEVVGRTAEVGQALEGDRDRWAPKRWLEGCKMVEADDGTALEVRI